MSRRVLRVLLPLFALLLPSGALAQAYQCKVPPSVSVPKVLKGGPTRRVPVTGYTLALSWSPEFCKGREAQLSHRMQCSGRSGYFGFVVHGLWPDGRGNNWPQWCANPRSVTPQIARRNLCMIPSVPLIAHEWAKHGACMAKKPETYFKVTRILFNSLRFGDFDALSRKTDLTAGEIRDLFVATNEGWRADAVGVKLNSRGWLQELRLCYDKRFRPAKCDAQRFGAKDETRVKIWRGL